MPKIASIEEFEGQWVQWWTVAQPEWRDTGSWPFEQGEASGDWGIKLSSGGKDGLFLVLMSLGWWAHARGPTVDCQLDAAISDVAWVMEHLVTSLSAAAIAPTSPEDLPTTSARSRRQHATSEKAATSRKRARV